MDTNQIFTQSEEVLLFLISELKLKNSGGFLCILRANQNDNDSEPFLGAMFVGQPEEERKKKYLSLSQAAAYRLLEHPNHRSSRQSQEKSGEVQGRAIRAGELIISFAGLDSEDANETIVLTVASSSRPCSRIISLEEAKTIAEKSGNKLFKKETVIRMIREN